jgi:hypothetical protein
MNAWNFPAFILVAVVAGFLVVRFLLRTAHPGRQVPDFECDVCGRRQRGLGPRQWRFCPFCGTPKLRSKRR